ncbi:hypothetical protein JTE90_002952 [Oedothorax gibbosus]|nr:hypothetical protein JTE90_002952 [Oedothorax gibbosus]
MYVNEWCEESCKNDTVKRSSLYGGRTFPCQHCSFIGPSVDSILYHFKYCPSLKKIQYSANQASDQNKHQFPRSDGACENVNASFDKTRLKRIRLDNSNQSPKNSQDQPDTSTSLDDKEKRKFGFAEKDVVWIKVEKGWWPALVWETNKNSTLFYIIFYDHVEP